MHVYHDDRCKFEISYPDDYVVQQGDTTNQQPQPACKVQFQSKQLAQSDTANLQPPQLLIEVYAKAQLEQPLDEWLKAQQFLGPQDQAIPFSLAGATGVQVTSQTLLVPDRFLYLVKGRNVYRLVPFGPTADRMLVTLKLSE
jgi:hypothetical protein